MPKKKKKETGKPIYKLKPDEMILAGPPQYTNPKRLLKNAPASALINTKIVGTRKGE